jgi:hypothetical protein
MFRNRETGEITIAQFPNVPLGIFIGTVGVRWFAADGTGLRTTLDWIGVAALGWWAVDEVLRGVNPWRRLLGVGGCAAAVAGLGTLVR